MGHYVLLVKTNEREYECKKRMQKKMVLYCNVHGCCCDGAGGVCWGWGLGVRGKSSLGFVLQCGVAMETASIVV